MADPIDLHVGREIKKARRRKGMSQSNLAAALSVSFQQVQKYEIGTNRVSSSKLARIAAALEVPVGDFFPEEYTRRDLTDDELSMLINYRAAPEDARLYILKITQQIADLPQAAE